jgi:hypothetical protein
MTVLKANDLCYHVDGEALSAGRRSLAALHRVFSRRDVCAYDECETCRGQVGPDIIVAARLGISRIIF